MVIRPKRRFAPAFGLFCWLIFDWLGIKKTATMLVWRLVTALVHAGCVNLPTFACICLHLVCIQHKKSVILCYSFTTVNYHARREMKITESRMAHGSPCIIRRQAFRYRGFVVKFSQCNISRKCAHLCAIQ